MSRSRHLPRPGCRSVVTAFALLGLTTCLLPRESAAGVDPAAGRDTGLEAAPPALRLAVTRGLARDADPEYRIDPEGRGVNPRHGLALEFTPRGALIERAAGDDGRAKDNGFALRLRRFGRGEGEPVRQAPPTVDGAWIEYERGAGLSEWFVNLPRGVEHGWTVAERPAGDGLLVLELDTGRPPDQIDGERLAWSGLDYHGLVARDAEGRELPAHWTSDGARLRIEVDDAAAAYPLVIDPWVQQAKLVADDGTEFDVFGSAVALSGDTALVGASQVFSDGPGAAYVFTRNGETWNQQAKLTADDGAEGDEFGVSVALSGDTALVGAEDADNGGAAYVFTRNGETWDQQHRLTADDELTNDFGASVALTGDTVLVGAMEADVDGNDDQGVAYVFIRSGETWSQQDKLVADDGAAFDLFGSAVALVDDTALVGASDASVSGNAFQGAAYVFTRSGETWSQQDKLVADDGAEGDRFGTSVALLDDTALVGAGEASVSGNAFQGAAYVFTRSDEAWSQTDKLVADDGAADGGFGVSVALSGDTALVGAWGAEVDNAFQGAAYVFTRSGEAWSQTDKLVADDGADGDVFGVSVALSGDTALVGAGRADVDDNSSQGAAYVFLVPLTPAALDVDTTPVASDGNGVFEPGEQVEMAPAWRNRGSVDAAALGMLSDFEGPGGASYDIADEDSAYGPIAPGEIGSCRSMEDCYELDLQITGPDRPAPHWDATVDEELAAGPEDLFTHTWTLHIGDSFTDVPRTNPFYGSIETLLHHEVTAGCTATEYCPSGANSRAQMPVFVLRALEAPGYAPPPCVEGEEVFDDVPATNGFCPWIQELENRDVITGCGGGNYCPESPVTRVQMAIFLLKTLEGGGYTPPECTEIFDDVPCPSVFADWIEDLANRGITSGCTGTEYCPGATVTRGQMAVFLSRAFELALYGV